MSVQLTECGNTERRRQGMTYINDKVKFTARCTCSYFVVAFDSYENNGVLFKSLVTFFRNKSLVYHTYKLPLTL